MSSRAGSSRLATDWLDIEANQAAQLSWLSVDERDELLSRPLAEQPNDGALALRLAAEEAHALSVFEMDREFALRLSIHGDDDIEGLAVSGGSGTRINPSPLGRSSAPTNQPGARRPDSNTGWGISSSTRTEVKTPAPPVERLTGHNCAVCMDLIRGVEIRAPCGDFYDKTCILELFEAATRDEALFPPRCCRQHIPFESVRPHMNSALIERFEEKKVEFGTLKRIYCTNQVCSRFLGPQIESSFKWWFISSYACRCGTMTCTWCKERVNPWDHRCTTEAERQDQVVLALGERSGWARCPGCGQLIELNLGCFHMTCRCRTEFCYVCKARWKTCGCPQWDEDRLLAAAEARVVAELERQVPPRPAPPARARAVVAAVPDARHARPVVQPDARPARPAAHDAHPVRPAQAVLLAARPAHPLVQPEARPARPATHDARPAQPPLVAQPVDAQPGADAQPPRRPYVEAYGIPDPDRSHRHETQWLPVDARPAGSWRQRVDAAHRRAVPPQAAEVHPAEAQPPRHALLRIVKVPEPASSELLETRRSRTGAAVAGDTTTLLRTWRSTNGSAMPGSPAHPSSPPTPANNTPAVSAKGKAVERPQPDNVGDRSSWRKSRPRNDARPSAAQASDSRLRTPIRSPSTPADDPVASSKGKGVDKPVTTGVRENMVREWMERLRENHDCDHEKWKYRQGGGRCEMCSKNLPLYLFRCGGCAMLACNRCRKNRI